MPSDPTTPRVSIVIPAYNHAKWIGETLQSVLDQTFGDWEAVVVDDGSKDETGDIVRRFSPQIRYVRQENAGVSAARNAGLDLTRAPYVTFLDSDDIWPARTLENLVGCLDQNLGAGMVYGARCRMKEGLIYDCTIPSLAGSILVPLLMKDESLKLSIGSTMMRRSVLERVKPFDLRFSTSADYDLWLRIAAEYPVAFVREPVLHYRILPGSMHTNLRVFERDRLGVLEKFFSGDAGRRPEIASIKNEIYARAHYTIGGDAVHQGQWAFAMRHWALSARLRPAYLALRVIGWPMRQVTRALGYASRPEE